ncbi:DUF6711 family protein [Niameybacter massiliensis]|uniref:DUF6711 family protein n=1 Tax=Niameybacter massiliensis TaxID=1658108 RepID=UPI0006B5A5FF|nr:DUF6711 family protein [Niameybacter massiliensis]
MIRINGVDVQTPSSYMVNIMDITKSERNAKGNMQIDLINTKYKLELTWSLLTQTQITKILDALEARVTFEVTFVSPTGSKLTRTFYKGDRSAPLLDYLDGQARWKDFKVNLIEV